MLLALLAPQFAHAGDKGKPFKMDAMGMVNQMDFSLTVAGQATHLGRFTAAGRITSSVADPDHPGFLLRSGFLTFTAANGDLLETSFTDAEVNADSGLANGVLEVEGGTGRFSDAGGALPFIVQQTSATSPIFRLIVSGKIFY